MAWCVDQVEGVGLTISGCVVHARRLQLDRDAALTLQVHVVQELLLHVPVGHRACVLQQPIGQIALLLGTMLAKWRRPGPME